MINLWGGGTCDIDKKKGLRKLQKGDADFIGDEIRK
jgi:hypothetical protein